MLTALVGATLLPAPAPARADVPPATEPGDVIRLLGGWLARQVTADGTIRGGEVEARDEAFAALALGHSGVGADARERLLRHLRLTVAPTAAELEVTTLAATILALLAAGEDVRRAGPGAGVDLVAELLDRRQTGGVDDGRIGNTAPTDAVTAHATAMLALHQAGVAIDIRAATWLVEQQCPNGGWPTYRDAASRSTETCEVAVPTTDITAQALTALQVVDVAPSVDPLDYIRAAADDSGAIGRAIGLDATPASTAAGVLGIRSWTGAPPDDSWAGTQGRPQQIVALEQLGCGWHGADRGGMGAERHHAPEEPADPPLEPGDGGGEGGGEGGEDTDPPAGAAADPILQTRVLASLVESGWWEAPASQPVLGDPFADCPVATARLAGEGRAATAVAVSRTTFPDGAETVVLASGRGYADALAGAPLAGRSDGPLLLSEPTELPQAVADEIVRLGARQVILLGGPAALSESVEEQAGSLEGVAVVRRIAGPDRYSTAVAIAEEVGGDARVIVRGDGPAALDPWADALSASGWAAATGRAILLAEPERLPEVTAAALAGSMEATLVGGTASLSAQVESETAAIVPRTSRIAGANRFATSAAVVLQARREGLDARSFWLVTGADFPDALSAGAGSAAAAAMLLLVNPESPAGGPDAVRTLSDVDYLVDRLVSIGGEVAVPASIAADLAEVVRAESGVATAY